MKCTRHRYGNPAVKMLLGITTLIAFMIVSLASLSWAVAIKDAKSDEDVFSYESVGLSKCGTCKLLILLESIFSRKE